MADVAHPPPTSPPPIYSGRPLRSMSPQVQEDSQRAHNTAYESNMQTRPALRQTISIISNDATDKAKVQDVTSAAVMVHPPSGQPFMEASSATVEHLSEQDFQSSIRPVSSDQRMQPVFMRDDPARLSPAPRMMPIRHVLQDADRNNQPHRRVASDVPSIRLPEVHQRPMRHVSASNIDNIEHTENFQPLQYHHQRQDEQDLAKRASKLTIGTNYSDGSTSSDLRGRDQRPMSAIANSAHGRALQRPDSGFSSTSDFRGRNLSPAPNEQARATSAHSRSPEVRPLSYVDLLNVPYPQPPPGGAEKLHNPQLRAAVGTNASLLSTRKTLEMYRANAKKTTDLATQYQFAIFMVSAAQEASIESEDLSASGLSEKSSAGSIQADLLKEARTILQRLSDRSYPFAQYYLADGYSSGLFNKGKEDYDKAFPLFLAASKHGHAEAGYRTALCYEFGWGCRVDGSKAVQFYQHAASKNHPGAMLRLGRACLMGDMGLGKRYREGVRWLKRASESADFQYNAAPYELGVLHENGYGPDVFKDESYAAQMFTKAADLGHVEANYRLGDAYEHGKLNCPRDAALSVHFYTGAAQQGHPLAQLALCAWYMVGAEPVLEKDENEAYEWARRAAESGLAKAEYTVGYFTEMGIGCRRDPLEANVWYVRAADQGDERAKHRKSHSSCFPHGLEPLWLLTMGARNISSAMNGRS